MTGLAGGRLDLHGARRDLGDLELEEPLDQARMAPADHDLGTLGRLADLDDVRLQSRPVLVALVGDLLGLGQQRLDLAQVEQRVPVVGLLDDAGHDVTLAPCVLLVLEVAFHFPDALEDDLLGRLGRDAAEVVRRVVPFADDVAVLVELLAVDADLTRVGVDRDDRLLGGVGTPLVGGDQGIGQGVEQRLDRDPLVACDLAEGIEELEVRLAHGVTTCFLFCVCFCPVGLPPGLAPDFRPAGLPGVSCPPHTNTVRARSMSL